MGDRASNSKNHLIELCPGGAQTISKFPSQFPGAYPRSLVAGAGAHVQAEDGTWYTDWICSLGALSLGYGDPDVDAAVRGQVMRGPIFSLPNRGLEERVAQQLVDLVPCAESVRFLKTGSEATEAAVRVARAATGREIILTCGYHSWHSWYAATRPQHPGVPEAMTGLARAFRYNDLASLDEMIAWANHQGTHDDWAYCPGVAAIILEPTLIVEPAPGFLGGVRERATRIGAVLIFDEMVTGFRWHRGGYQALSGVTPDLATFGKAMGNGYPVAALVGRGDLMRHARLASGTFNGDCVGLAAAGATIDRYDDRDEDVCGHMARLGRAIIDGYNRLAERYGLSGVTRAVGQAPHPKIAWNEAGAGEPSDAPGAYEAPRRYPARLRASLFYQEVCRRGHLLHPNGNNVMLAHQEAHVESLLWACGEAMRVVASASDPRALIEGDPISPEPVWRAVQ